MSLPRCPRPNCGGQLFADFDNDQTCFLCAEVVYSGPVVSARDEHELAELRAQALKSKHYQEGGRKAYSAREHMVIQCGQCGSMFDGVAGRRWCTVRCGRAASAVRNRVS